jgi:phage antirepressor YoqD-like protein
VEDMAKIIINKGKMIGRNRLFKFLREEKVLRKNNIPYQTYMERGWFKVTEGVQKTAYGDRLYVVTLVTPKGQVGIVGLVKDRYIWK